MEIQDFEADFSWKFRILRLSMESQPQNPEFLWKVSLKILNF